MVSMLKMFAKKKKAAVRHRDTIKRGLKTSCRGETSAFLMFRPGM